MRVCLIFPGAPHSNSSSSLQTGASLFGGGKDGSMHQRSFSVSSADQWNEAINTSTSSAARKTPPARLPPPEPLAPFFPPYRFPSYRDRRRDLFGRRGGRGRSAEGRPSARLRPLPPPRGTSSPYLIYSPCTSTPPHHTPHPVFTFHLTLTPSSPPLCSLFFRRGKWMRFGGSIHHQLFPSLWLAVKKHLNAHQQNNSHFHACLHSGSSH